jgi:hypothetical protein
MIDEITTKVRAFGYFKNGAQVKLHSLIDNVDNTSLQRINVLQTK